MYGLEIHNVKMPVLYFTQLLEEAYLASSDALAIKSEVGVGGGR
jgi:hypothetical protein